MLTPSPPSRNAVPQLPAPEAQPVSARLSFPGFNRERTPSDAGQGRSGRSLRSTPTAVDPASRQQLGSDSHLSSRQRPPRSARHHQVSAADARGQGDGSGWELADKVSYPAHCDAVSVIAHTSRSLSCRHTLLLLAARMPPSRAHATERDKQYWPRASPCPWLRNIRLGLHCSPAP